jgi:hypothetical protein
LRSKPEPTKANAAAPSGTCSEARAAARSASVGGRKRSRSTPFAHQVQPLGRHAEALRDLVHHHARVADHRAQRRMREQPPLGGQRLAVVRAEASKARRQAGSTRARCARNSACTPSPAR